MKKRILVDNTYIASHYIPKTSTTGCLVDNGYIGQKIGERKMTELSKLNFVSAVEVQSLVKDFGEKQDSKAGLQTEVKEFKPADIITAEGAFKPQAEPTGDKVNEEDKQKVEAENTFTAWVNLSEALFKLESSLTTINAIENDADKLAAFEKDINALEQLKADENNTDEVTAYNARLTEIKGYYTAATPANKDAETDAVAAGIKYYLILYKY